MYHIISMAKKAAISSRRVLYHCLLLAELIAVLILNSILKLSLRFFTYCSRSIHAKGTRLRNTSNEAKEDEKFNLTREEVEIVMKKMGMSFSHEGGCMDFDEEQISTIFEGEAPTLEEVEEAFCIFDENCDGFIDAIELQRVLLKLGYRDGADLDACQQMIEQRDENKDGKIGFNEFLRSMESSFNC